MKFPLPILYRMARQIPRLLLFAGLLLAFSEPSAAQVLEVVVEDPQLQPPYTTCQESYWYPFANNRGHTAYLTLNVNNPNNSTNQGEWRPLIPQPGYYRVEAYIAAHSAITWCTGQGRTIPHDTTDAHYTIQHANGVTERRLSQYPLGNQWLDLGEYYFTAGQNGYVSLGDLNAEPDFSTTISFSAMRFTFTRFTRSNLYLPLVVHDDPLGQIPPNRGVIQAQGFDACHLPEVSEMQAWWNHSPYAFYALYLGGISLYHGCAIASPAWVSAVHQQGWSFVPTWVGPQAPCSTWAHKMSMDPAVSYQEGRSEAQAASSAAAGMGLTNDGLGGTIIYYDMEAYWVSTPECRQPVAAFMNGWVQRLHELGNLAGSYATRNTYPSDWATIPNVPDDIWPASWYRTNYDPWASVNGIDWIFGLWINHQRIRQYAGEVGNTWGGVSLSIDIDVADGMVAMPPTNPLSTPIIIATPSIMDAGWLSTAQGWLVMDERLYRTADGGDTWQDISPAPVQVAYMLPSGQTLALSTNDDRVILYHSSDRGAGWLEIELHLPLADWRPLQLQFTTPSSGWIVMQKVTSQAFEMGVLLKTRDGGLSWQSYDLPAAAPIHFVSGLEGWMRDPSNELLYRSMDGGETWQPVPAGKYPYPQPVLPEGSTLSGWQAGGLGWAATSTGSCEGEKSAPGFTCRVENSLWQTLDGGNAWRSVSLPAPERIKR
ncbi:MAG: hypothetical protein A2136_05030 [Chloroflexi bacterium RBG_16_54_11]|nr:MAG: hypothetical protein A2136_05030 [Chloroflexi bacterium RBG_16_54_11]